jgi:hypothetical protein
MWPIAPSAAVRPTRCVLCLDDRIVLHDLKGSIVLACHTCGALLRITPHPAHEPSVADRVDILMAPTRKPTLH